MFFQHLSFAILATFFIHTQIGSSCEEMLKLPLSSRASLHLERGSREKPLTSDEELLLATKIQTGDPSAHKELVERNIALVINIATGYSGRGVPLRDLIQEGSIGLISAAKNYKPNTSARFSTYASYWIKKQINKALAQDRLLSVPYWLYIRVHQIETIEKNGTPLTDKEIGQKLNLAEMTHEHLTTVRLAQKFLALKRNRVMKGNEEEVAKGIFLRQLTMSSLIDEKAVRPESLLMEQEERDALNMALQTLDEIERRVLEKLFGLKGEPPSTLWKVVRELHIKRETVKAIEQRALIKLKAALSKAI